MSNPMPPRLPNPPPLIQHMRFIEDPGIDWREFTVFPKLPAELRLKIWAYAWPDPRIITIETVPPIPSDYRVSYQDRVPSTLLVNRESREVALRRYSLRFSTFANVYGPPVYIDLDRDVILVKRCGKKWWTDFNDQFNRDLSLVKRVIIQNRVHQPLIKTISRTVPFSNMNSLGLVADDPKETWSEQYQILCSVRKQVASAKGASDRFGGTEAKVLKDLQIYFLSWGAVIELELGEFIWQLG